MNVGEEKMLNTQLQHWLRQESQALMTKDIRIEWVTPDTVDQFQRNATALVPSKRHFHHLQEQEEQEEHAMCRQIFHFPETEFCRLSNPLYVARCALNVAQSNVDGIGLHCTLHQAVQGDEPGQDSPNFPFLALCTPCQMLTTSEYNGISLSQAGKWSFLFIHL